MTTPCPFKLPTEIDVNTYLPRLANIVTQLSQTNDKTVAIERMDLLMSEINLAIIDNSGTKVFPVNPTGTVKLRKKKNM